MRWTNVSAAAAVLLISGTATAQQLFDPDRIPALAAADPAVSIEYFPSGALRARPELMMTLTETAAAFGRSVALNAREELALQQAETPDRAWRSHTLALYDTLRLSAFGPDGGLTSVLRAIYVDQGGAHPNLEFRSWLWRDATGETLPLTALFAGGSAPESFVEGWRAALTAAKLERFAPELEAEVAEEVAARTPDFSATAFTLAPSTEPGRAAGVVLHHAPYEVGVYAEGPYEILVPLSVFEADLSPAVRPYFAGAPGLPN